MTYQDALNKWAAKAVHDKAWFGWNEHFVDNHQPTGDAMLRQDFQEGFSYSEYTEEPSHFEIELYVPCTCGETMRYYRDAKYDDTLLTQIIQGVIEAGNGE